MAQRSLALVESTKEEERALCNIPINDFTLLQTKRMFELLSRLNKVEKFPNQAYEELYIRRDELRRALPRSALTIFHELDLASLIHRAGLEAVLNETGLLRSQVEGIKIERPFVEAEFSLKTQIQGLVEIYEERQDNLNAHECLAIARLEFQYKEWRQKMRDAYEWIGHDNGQCRLDAIAALIIPLPLESLSRHDRECAICHEEFGSTVDREAELPVKLPCGHTYGNLCLQDWLLENSTCGHCRRDYSEILPDDFQDIDDSEDEDSDDLMGDDDIMLD